MDTHGTQISLFHHCDELTNVKCHLVDTLYVSVGPCPTFSLTV